MKLHLRNGTRNPRSPSLIQLRMNERGIRCVPHPERNLLTFEDVQPDILARDQGFSPNYVKMESPVHLYKKTSKMTSPKSVNAAVCDESDVIRAGENEDLERKKTEELVSEFRAFMETMKATVEGIKAKKEKKNEGTKKKFPTFASISTIQQAEKPPFDRNAAVTKTMKQSRRKVDENATTTMSVGGMDWTGNPPHRPFLPPPPLAYVDQYNHHRRERTPDYCPDTPSSGGDSGSLESIANHVAKTVCSILKKTAYSPPPRALATSQLQEQQIPQHDLAISALSTAVAALTKVSDMATQPTSHVCNQSSGQDCVPGSVLGSMFQCLSNRMSNVPQLNLFMDPKTNQLKECSGCQCGCGSAAPTCCNMSYLHATHRTICNDPFKFYNPDRDPAVIAEKRRQVDVLQLASMNLAAMKLMDEVPPDELTSSLSTSTPSLEHPDDVLEEKARQRRKQLRIDVSHAETEVIPIPIAPKALARRKKRKRRK